MEPALKLLRGKLAADLKGAEGLKESDEGGMAWRGDHGAPSGGELMVDYGSFGR